jgi:hypothetical protein
MNSSSILKECCTSSAKPEEHGTSSVKPEKKEDVMVQKGAPVAKPTDDIEPRVTIRATTPVQSKSQGTISTLTQNTTMLSSIKELLANSRLMLESLEHTEGVLAALQPEVIDLCTSPQDGTFETSKLPTDTSPINGTQLTFTEIKEQQGNNLEIIRKAAEERATLMVLIQDKTTENAMLSSLIIKLSEKQDLMWEELEREYALMNEKVENARTMKREMVRMYARVMSEETEVQV